MLIIIFCLEKTARALIGVGALKGANTVVGIDAADIRKFQLYIKTTCTTKKDFKNKNNLCLTL